MTDTTKTGGFAFPHQACPTVTYHGMTLRDWFAGQALVGYLSCPNWQGDMQEVAADCYNQADAMIAARGET